MIDQYDLMEKLKREARFLHIYIPYDKDDECGLISFDDGLTKYSLTTKQMVEKIMQ